MFPFWLWPYPGRLISGFIILLLAYLAAPAIFTYDSFLWFAAVAYLAGHWVWFYYRRYINRRIIAFDVGGVIVQGDYYTEKVKPMPGMYELITKVRQTYVTAVLSNNNRLVDVGFRQQFKSDDMFDVVFYSSDLGKKKPDVEIFKKFAAKMGVHPEQVTFFDDDAGNVEAAKKVGFNANVFKSAAQAAEIIYGH